MNPETRPPRADVPHLPGSADALEWFRVTLASIGDAVIATDIDGRVVFLNPVAETLTGWSTADARGQALDAVFRIVNEETRGTVPSPATRVLEEGVILGLANHTVLIAKDGTTERPIDDSAAPIRGADGEIVGCVLIFRDVTERRRAERAVEYAKAYAESIIATVREPLLVLDDELRVRTANRSFYDVFAVEAGQTEGAFIYDLGNGQWNIPSLRSLLEEVLPRNASFHDYEVTHEFPDIGRRVMLLNARSVRRAHADTQLILLAFEDITQRQQIESRLRENETFNRSLMEGSTDCVKVLDVEGRLIHMNTPGKCLMEIDDFGDVRGRDWGTLWPEEAQADVAHALERARRGEPTTFTAFGPTAKGTPKWWSVAVSPVRGREGRVERVLSVSRDITSTKQLEARLRTQAADYRSLVDATTSIVWWAGPDGAVYDAPRWTALTGQTSEQLSGWGWLDAVHPEDRPEARELWRESIRTKTMAATEHRLRTQSGDYRWVSVRGVPVFDAMGELREWVGTITDIHEQRDAKERLRESEARFRGMADNAPVMIWMTEPDATCSYLSKSWYRFTGQSSETGVPFGWLHAIHPEDRPEAERAFLGANARHEPFVLEYRLRHREGDYRWVIDSAAPRLGDDGTFLGYIGSVIDITARKRAEERLRESEARFRRVFSNDMIPMGVWTKAGDFADANDALLELIGYTRAELLEGRIRWQDLTPIEFAARDQKAIAEVDTYGACRSYEKAFLRKDGSRVPILIGGGRFDERAGSGLLYVVDLSEQKRGEHQREEMLAVAERARSAAESASRAKDEFLAVLSHELRSPMNAMLGWLRILKTAGNRDPSLVEKAVDTIERNVWVQSQVINDLLDVSRIISGKLQVERERVDAGAIVLDCIDSLRPSAEGKQVTLTLELGSRDMDVVGDSARLQQVVTNLVGNAIKFTPAGGSVAVTVAGTRTDVQIVVEDTGQGIDPEFMPYLFDRFRQEDSSRGRKHGGLGLGLAIVKNVVELQGGSVTVQSGGVGQGARFTVTLPPAEARTAVPLPSKATTELDDSTSMTAIEVLIVEDDADSRLALRLALEDHGARVRVASSVSQAIAAYDALQPTVLISDIGLPGEDGYVLIRAIREREERRGHHTLAIAMTGFAGRQDRDTALRAGFDEHVAKPVEPAQLFERIRVLRLASAVTLRPAR